MFRRRTIASVRKATLYRSVARLLDGADVHVAAFMWRRHRWMMPYAAVAGIAVYLLASSFGIDDTGTRVALGLAAGAVAVNASSDYKVLARTSVGLVLCRASRIRQYAVAVDERLTDPIEVEAVGGTLLATDWRIGDVGVFTVPKSSEQAVQAIGTG